MKNEEKKKKEPATGKYVYDKVTGKVVKVSDRASATKKSSTPALPSCGSGGCCCG